MMTKVIDAHSHFMPPRVAEQTTFFKVNWSDVNRQLSVMDDTGIAQALLLYPTSDAHLRLGGWKGLCEIYNQEIAHVVQEHSDRLIGAGILPADAPQDIPGELKRIRELGLRVISLASSYEGIYLDDQRFFSVYEFAQKHGMPVHVHPQIMNPIGADRVQDPLLTPVLEYVFDVSICIGKLMMSEVFLKYSDVNFIFAHYGGVLPFVKERFDNTYAMLRKREFVKDLSKLPGDYFKNLYFDTSGSKSYASLLCALEVTDTAHILYGSDFPANQRMKDSIDTVEKAALDEKDKEFILSANLLKLL